MPRARLVVALVLGALAAGCAASARVALERAQAEAQAGRSARALQKFDAVAARKDASDAERVEALLGATHACDALKDEACARARLERAVEKDAPGVVEPALFELAERVRNEDRARALSLYYRAAGGAEKHRGRAWPYKAAMDRILQISLAP
jgi:lipopolysaccharide biosynthesis regulator YciM